MIPEVLGRVLGGRRRQIHDPAHGLSYIVFKVGLVEQGSIDSFFEILKDIGPKAKVLYLFAPGFATDVVDTVDEVLLLPLK